MDTDTLVDGLIESGERLIEELVQAGMPVTVAAWVKLAEEGRWALIIASKDSNKGPIAGYRIVTDALRKIGDPQLSVSDVRLVKDDQPLARDLIDAQPTTTPRRSRFTMLTGMAVEEMFVYPPVESEEVDEYAAAHPAAGVRQTVLRFVLHSTEHPIALMARFNPQGKQMLNRTEWRGKEPRSCAVTSIKGEGKLIGSPEPPAYRIIVTYRPKGCITYVSETKYDGWDALMLDRSPDGTLLDGEGKPLPEESPPVYRRVELLDDTDFNEIDFGEFVDEVEVGGIKHLSFEQMMKRFTRSKRMNVSMESSFVAARRHRPGVKIALVTGPAGMGMDGFGTVVRTINNSIPHVQQAIIDHLNEVVSGFMEGRYSIKNMSTEDFVFAEIGDVFVDCTPNATGKPSRFNCLGDYLPPSFLEELAIRLTATYDINVSVVDGPQLGLMLSKTARNR